VLVDTRIKTMLLMMNDAFLCREDKKQER